MIWLNHFDSATHTHTHTLCALNFFGSIDTEMSIQLITNKIVKHWPSKLVIQSTIDLWYTNLYVHCMCNENGADHKGNDEVHMAVQMFLNIARTETDGQRKGGRENRWPFHQYYIWAIVQTKLNYTYQLQIHLLPVCVCVLFYYIYMHTYV